MNRLYWAILGIVTVLLAIASFADLRIAEMVFNRDSAFGHFFAVAAMIPIWTLGAMASGLLFGALAVRFGALTNISRFICIGLQAFSIYATYKLISGLHGSRHLHGLPFEALVCIVLAVFLFSAALGGYASRRYPREVFAAAIIGVIAVCGSRMLLDGFKDAWGRQRFWTMDDPIMQFTAWYLPQFPDAARIAEMGDKIKSFPSGHSLGSISLLWLSLFPAFIGFCRKNLSAWVTGTSVFAVGFWGCAMFSRLILGEHFLSDVSMSAIIFLAIFMAARAAEEPLGGKLFKNRHAAGDS